MVEATRKEMTPSVVGYCGARRQIHQVDHQSPQQMTMVRDQTPPKLVVRHPPGSLQGTGFLLKETLHPEPPDVTKRVSTVPSYHITLTLTSPPPGWSSISVLVVCMCLTCCVGL